jgi:hypothetical protein
LALAEILAAEIQLVAGQRLSTASGQGAIGDIGRRLVRQGPQAGGRAV